MERRGCESGAGRAVGRKFSQTTKASVKFRLHQPRAPGRRRERQGTGLPILLLRDERGFAQVTRSKKHRSWSYSSVTSRPRKILAMKIPPGRRTWRVMFRACNARGGGWRREWRQRSVRVRRGLGREADRVAYGEEQLGLDELVEVVQSGHCVIIPR